MIRRPSPLEAGFPLPGDFITSIEPWRQDAISALMRYVWTGTKNLTDTLRIDLTQDMEHLERGLNQVLAQCIRDAMTDQPPFFLEHHPFAWSFFMEIALPVGSALVGALFSWLFCWIYYRKGSQDLDNLAAHLKDHSDQQVVKILESAAQVLNAKGKLDIKHNSDGSTVFTYRGGVSLFLSGAASATVDRPQGGLSITGRSPDRTE
jgi:hypothetical protein